MSKNHLMRAALALVLALVFGLAATSPVFLDAASVLADSAALFLANSLFDWLSHSLESFLVWLLWVAALASFALALITLFGDRAKGGGK